MTTLYNEISINAPIDKIWDALSNIEELEKYDPTVKKTTAISQLKSGIGAKRKVEMEDGKNWLEEQCTDWMPNDMLAYELTACSFPIHKLRHSYSFNKNNNEIKVKQIMQYQVKFGLIGIVLDSFIIRKQFDTGIKKFMEGLKAHTESKKSV